MEIKRELEDKLKGLARKYPVVTVTGPRQSGKTTLVKEHIRNLKDAVYIDLERISLNPENFAVEFAGNIIFWLLKKPQKEYKKFLLLENILKAESELKSKNAFALVKTIENELLKIKPDQRLLVDCAFRLIQAIGKDTNKKIVIALDNFENILDLNNFSQMLIGKFYFHQVAKTFINQLFQPL